MPEGTRFVHDVTYDASQDMDIHTEHAVLPPPASADGGSVPVIAPEVIPWDFIDDCTHFMSCCVGRPPGAMKAGGLPVPWEFPSGPYGIVSADRFVTKLVSKGWLKVIPVANKKTPGLERIAAGDLIGYYRISKGRYAHLAMYAGEENIVCHSYCRSDLEACTWDHRYDLGVRDPDWHWRLLRFVTKKSSPE